MQIWLTCRKRIMMKPSAKIWRRRIAINQTCTRSMISLWSKQMNNYKIRRRRTPPFRRSINIVSSDISGSMYFPHQQLVQYFHTQKVLDRLSLYIWSTTTRFAAYRQDKMSRWIKRMNPATQLILTELSDQSSSDHNINSREDLFLEPTNRETHLGVTSDPC